MHIKALPTSLCSYPLHPHYLIKMMLLKNASSVVTMVIFTYNFVFCLSFLCQLVLRNAVWCDTLQNIGYHTTLCCILDTYFVLVSF